MSQLKKIKAELDSKGFISRNFCLRNYISRLSAIIYNLKDEGYEFETFEKDGDYIYKVINKPKKVEYVYSKEKNSMIKILN